MLEFEQVPVPKDLVIEVMRFIANRADERHVDADAEQGGGVGNGNAQPPQGLGVSMASRDWTREQFEMIRASDASSVRKFCQVLTILAEASPSALSPDEVGAQLGLQGIDLQRAFGPASKWMGNRMDGDLRWPIHWQGDKWFMNEHNATLWKEVTQ